MHPHPLFYVVLGSKRGPYAYLEGTHITKLSYLNCLAEETDVEAEQQLYLTTETPGEEGANALSLPHFVFHFIGKKMDLGHYYLQL